MKITKILGVAGLCIALSFGVMGCASSNQESTTDEEQSADTAVERAWVEGTITEVSEGELLVEITSDNTGVMTGPIRVGTESISDETIAEMSEGIVIEVTYSGAVGMSNPPFISAQDIAIVQER